VSFVVRVERDQQPVDTGEKEDTMELNPYLTFNGQCEAAFRFYERCLGGKIEMMLSHGDSPMAEQTPPAWRSKIMHARLIVAGRVLMGSDAPPDRYQEPKGFSVSLGVENPAEAERIFQALAEKGTVQMALQQTFWAVRFGMVVDRFGIPWMVNCEQGA
jgi:PhnB protein